jgi:protein-disulfide isomerase
MTQVMNEYGDDGKVKWVFRHFPLDVLHAKARPVAIASECVAAQAGEEGFWKFADRYNELTLSNDQTDLDTVLPQIAQEIGIDTKVFSACLTSGAHDAKILANETDAKLLQLNAAHNISKTDYENNISFVSIMEDNLKNLQIGLRCNQ